MFNGVKFDTFPDSLIEPNQKAILCAEVGDKSRVDGTIFPAVQALLGCRKISDVLARGIATLNNFIAMVLPHKLPLFASKFELVC